MRLATRAGPGVPIARAMSHIRSGPPSRRIVGLLLLLAAAAVLLQGASVPHTHAASRPGFYNQDHDLVLLATLHSTAVMAAAPPVPLMVVLTAGVTPPATRPLAAAARSTCDCRAPPHA